MADCVRMECDPAEAPTCASVYGEDGKTQVVLPTRGDNYFKWETLVCALKQVVDGLNALESVE